MSVGYNLRSLYGHRLCLWSVLTLAAIAATACSSGRDERAEAADAGQKAAASEEGTEEVLAAFDAWAQGDKQSGGEQDAGGEGSGRLDGVIDQFNRKVRTCWKQPFGMPRLATVRLLVQFNPDGTVRRVSPRPEASEALSYRTETPYLVMIAQTSRALRQCQPYQVIRQNFAELNQLEMVVDPRMFRN